MSKKYITYYMHINRYTRTFVVYIYEKKTICYSFYFIY